MTRYRPWLNRSPLSDQAQMQVDLQDRQFVRNSPAKWKEHKTQSKLTQIRTSCASECIPQETAPTAACGLASILSSDLQPLPITRTHLLYQATLIVSARIENYNRPTSCLLGFEFGQTASTSFACTLALHSTIGGLGFACGYRTCEIFRS